MTANPRMTAFATPASATPAFARPPGARTALAALILLGLAACSTVAPDNSTLTGARNAYQAAQANAQTQGGAAAELRQAGEALAWRTPRSSAVTTRPA